MRPERTESFSVPAVGSAMVWPPRKLWKPQLALGTEILSATGTSLEPEWTLDSTSHPSCSEPSCRRLLPSWAQRCCCCLGFIPSSFLRLHGLPVTGSLLLCYSEVSVEMWPQLMAPGRKGHRVVLYLLVCCRRGQRLGCSRANWKSVCRFVSFALPDCHTGQQSTGSSRWGPFQSLTSPALESPPSYLWNWLRYFSQTIQT